MGILDKFLSKNKAAARKKSPVRLVGVLSPFLESNKAIQKNGLPGNEDAGSEAPSKPSMLLPRTENTPNVPSMRWKLDPDTRIDLNFGRTKAVESISAPDVDTLKKNLVSARLYYNQLQTVGARGTGIKNNPNYIAKLTAAEKRISAAETAYEAGRVTKAKALKNEDAGRRADALAEFEAVRSSEPKTMLDKLSSRGFDATAASGRHENEKYFAPMDRSEGTHIYFGTQGLKHKKVNYMTPGEQDVYAYYLKTNREKAKKYYDLLSTSLNYRMQQDTSAKVSELSETHPALGVAYNVTGSFASPLALAGTAGHVAGDAIRGKETPLDTNTTMFSGTHMVNDSAEGIKRKTSTPLGDFLVDTGLSIAQFASKLPLGPAALPMMASGAGGQAALDVSERGGTAQQALKMGLVSAAAEYFTEKISLDRLLKIYKAGGAGFKDTLKTTAKNLGRQSVTEASEELLSEYINNVGDELIMKEQSQMSAYVNELVAGGMDAADALRKASVQFWVVNPLLAGAGGALSGGVMGAGGTVAGNVRQAGADSRLGTELRSSWGSDYDSAVAELVETGHEYMPETGSGYYADKAGEKLANGKQLTNREVGQLYRANLAAQEAEAEAYFTGRDPVNPIRRNDPLHPPGENEMQEFAIKRRQYEYGLQLANTLREYGVKNVVIEEMPDGENGRWENGTVYVSSRLDTAQAINAKVAHEISHAAQEGDAAFSGDVVLAMRDAGWDVDGAINAKRSTYTEFFEKQGKSKQWIADTVTEDYAADEVAADFIGELMRDGSLAQRLNTKPTLVHRIIDTVNRLLGGRVSTTERAAYTKLSQRLRTVAGVMGKGMSTNEYGASEEARFSIKNTRLMPWEQQVQEYFGESGALKSSDSMYLGETEAFLVNDGVPVAPLYIPTAVINKATREQKGSKSGHGLTQGQILKLKNGIESAPAIIHNPARNALIYLTENKDSEGRYIVATFDLSNNLYGERAHKATSIHGREAIDNLLYALDGSAKVFVKSKNKLDTIAGVQTDKSPKLLANVEFVNNNVPQAGTDVNGDKRYSVDESVDNNSKIASDIDVMELPAKARNYLHRSENGLSRQIAKLLDVPSPAGRSFLKPIVQKISQEYMNSGELSDDTVSSLFETAWDEGIAVSDEFYNEYKDLKDDLRTVAVTISEKDSGDIADYGAWLKHQFGRLKIFKTGGTPVDVRYMELSDNYPDLFPEGITHPADQLRQMSEVAQSITRVEESLDKFYGADAEFMKKAAKHEFETIMMNYLPELQTVRKYYEQRVRDAAEREKTLSFAGMRLSNADLAAIKQLWSFEKESSKKVERAVSRNLMTDLDNSVVDRLLRGELTTEALPENCNIKGVREVYAAKAEKQELMGQIQKINTNRKAALRQEADGFLEDALSWKDKGAGLLYQRETMERNIRDIVKDKKTADAIIKRYFEPVHKNEAERTNLKNTYRERVKALKLSRKLERGNKLSEAAAVQIYGEALDNIEVLEKEAHKNPEEDWRNGHTLSEWKAIALDVLDGNPNMDIKKVKDALEELHTIYNELFEKMNEARIRNGYEPVDYRRGYFPHFQNEQGDGMLAKFGHALGITMNVTELPTTINGITHTFRPGIRWQGSALAREGFNTVYDAVEGFDRYIEGVSDVICHTDDIQALRAFADQVRYRSSDDGIREQIDAVLDNKSLGIEEKEDKIRAIYEQGHFTLSNFVVNLEEYTNLLANKKAFADRNMERAIGRKSYDLVKALENRVAANMVAVNPGSWLTNFIPLVQGGAQLKQRELLKGMWDALKSHKTDDGFAAYSGFLVNRRGSKPLVQNWQQKASSTMSTPMEWIDSFVSDSLVRARFSHNRAAGMSEQESIDEADRWTSGVMADRSKGALPILFESKNPVTKTFTQFQLEVNNQLSYLFKDLPQEQREKGIAALAGALLKFFLGAWLFNEVYEYFVGRRPALDPIGILNDTVGSFTGYELPNLVETTVGAIQGKTPDFTTEKKDLGAAGVNLAKGVVEELPFIGGLLGGGRVPISSAIPDVGKVWGATVDILGGSESSRKAWNTLGKEALKPAAYIIPPFGGGQLKKMYQGIRAVIESGRFSVDGKGNDILQYPVYNDSPLKTGLNAAQAGLFGPTALKTGQDWIEGGFKTLNSDETGVYRILTKNGTPARLAYDIITQLKNAEKEGDGDGGKSRIEVQRNILRNSKLTGLERDAVYYGLLASDEDRTLMDTLDEMKTKYGQSADLLLQFEDVKSTQEESTAAQKAQILLSAKMTDEQKRVIYEAKVNDEYHEIIDQCLAEGMSFDEYLAIADSVEGRNGGAYTQKYIDITSAGIAADDAAELVDELVRLEPESGKEQVSDLQKARQVSDMSFSDTDKLVALNALTSDGFYQRAYAASQHGISVDSFVGFKEQLPRFDHNGNGSYTQAEVVETLNSFQELNNDQRAVLWQIQTGGKHNPYNSAIGAQVKAEIADSKTVGTAQNAAERETKGRKTFGNGLLSAFMDNTDTSVQKTEQQALGNGLLSAYMD